MRPDELQPYRRRKPGMCLDVDDALRRKLLAASRGSKHTAQKLDAWTFGMAVLGLLAGFAGLAWALR